MFAFVIDFVFVSLSVYYLLYRYRKKYFSWRYKIDCQNDFINDTDMAKFVVKIDKIP